MIELVLLLVSNCTVFQEEIIDSVIKSFCDICSKVTIFRKSIKSLCVVLTSQLNVEIIWKLISYIAFYVLKKFSARQTNFIL